MMYFVYNYNHNETKDIFEKIAGFHIEFEHIHPFEDGNGRTGRLFINFPPIVIPKEERTKYFELLRSKDITALASWLKELSDKEKERIELFNSSNS